MTEDMYSRTKLLLGSDNVEKLRKSSVLLCGCGAVGGYAAESLIRTGIGSITFADGDTFDETNLNRQIICTDKTLGRNKAESAVERALSINRSGKFTQYPKRITQDSLEDLLSEKYDAVADCIDTMQCKADLIRASVTKGIKVFSAMGCAMHKDPSSFRVANLADTSKCPVAKIMRKELSDIDQSNVITVYSTETPIEVSETKDSHGKSVLGSVQPVTAVAGNLLAWEIIKYLCERK